MALTITHVNTTPGPSNKVDAADWTASHTLAGDYLRKATVTLSSADILDLHNTGVTLVAAPGAGKVVVPSRITTFLTFGTVAYTFAGDVAVSYNFDGFGLGNACQLATLTAVADSASFMYPGSTGSTLTADVANAPLMVFATGAITTGDGTLTITTWYSIEDVP